MRSLLLAISGTSILAVCAGLSVFLASEVIRAEPAITADLARDEIVETLSVETSQSSTRTSRSKIYYAAVLERPLFVPERRPLVLSSNENVEQAPAVAEAAVSSERPTLKLYGIMLDTNGGKALIAVSDNSPQWVKRGAKVSEGVLSNIGSDWVEVTLAKETFRFEMYQ